MWGTANVVNVFGGVVVDPKLNAKAAFPLWLFQTPESRLEFGGVESFIGNRERARKPT